MSQVAHAIAIESVPDPTLPDLDAASVLRHAAHELRQPLSTMESIAYYLELILPDADERGREQLEKLRKLVEQSNWIVAGANGAAIRLGMKRSTLQSRMQKLGIRK